MTFKKFEEIEAWQLARSLCDLVKTFTEKHAFASDWPLKNQIKSASGSVMDCIAEGYERDHKNEFLNFLGVAKGSCGEVRSQCYRALDYGYITSEEFESVCLLAQRTSGAITGLQNYLKRSAFKGVRHKAPIEKDAFFPPTEPQKQP